MTYEQECDRVLRVLLDAVEGEKVQHICAAALRVTAIMACSVAAGETTKEKKVERVEEFLRLAQTNLRIAMYGLLDIERAATIQ